MSRFIKIGEAAKICGVTPQTLRRWEREGTLIPDRVTKGNTRYYDVDKLLNIKGTETELTVGYARVSSHDQKKDLKYQEQALSSYCTTIPIHLHNSRFWL